MTTRTEALEAYEHQEDVYIQAQVDRAVLIERERCAGIDPYTVPCPICNSSVGEDCCYINPHPERITAAIRQDPKQS